MTPGRERWTLETRVDERVVDLTGANAGIGYHMLTALIEGGRRIAALDVERNNLRDVRNRSPDQVLFYECDVPDPDDVRAAIARVVDRWERIDIPVNNAAVANFAAFYD